MPCSDITNRLSVSAPSLSFGEWLPACRRTVVLFFLVCLTLHADGIAILRNVGNYSPNDTVSHHRTPASSATPLREPQISQFIEYSVATLYFHFLQLPSWTDSHDGDRNVRLSTWSRKVTRLKAGQPRNRGSIAGRDTSPDQLWGPPSLIRKSTWVLSWG